MRKSILNLFGALAVVAMTTEANGQIVVLAEAPSAVEGSYNFTNSGDNAWGANLANVNVSAPVVLYRDATAADTLACAAAANANELAGNIAFLYRGTCEFGAKALNAQTAGAVAVIIINNAPGEPVGMGAGASGNQVTIPVVMLSQSDGALLRPYVDNGTLEMFIGNKTGLFASDAGFQRKNVALAKNFATPVQFAASNTDFYVPVGAWVHNYGSDNQTGVQLNVTVSVNGDVLYNETSAPANITSGDSLLVSLDDFAPTNYPVGYYTMTFTINTAVDDEFPNDNVIVTNFWVNDQGLYSKTRIDPSTSMPLGGGGIRPSDGTEYSWCTFMRSSNASAMKVDGVSFATVTNSGVTLEGEAVLVEILEWNDPFDETTTELTFNDLTQVGEVFFDYPVDSAGAAALQNEFVTAYFDQPVLLENGIKYLTCISIFIDNMFVLVDGAMNYDLTYNAYPLDIFFPLKVEGTWNAVAFGPDYVPAIITHLSQATGIADDVVASQALPYPNPTNDMVTIPLGASVNGKVLLNVFDLSGRELMTQSINGTANNALRVDASSLNSGMHLFRLTFEDGTSTTFRVQVNK
jgi:hypothetical protein